jgi:hypothetical protein
MTLKHNPLEKPYIAEFDTVNEQQWYDIIDRFQDANMYQTWSYDAVRQGEKNLSHFLLKSPDGIVAAAQARIAKIPVLGIGAAYIRWAPLWRAQGKEPDSKVFQLAIRALRNEYVIRRGLILRIFPVLYDTEHAALKDVLLNEGYFTEPGETPQRTLVLDIQPDAADIRKNFDQKWRNCLNKAEKNQLEIIEGNDDSLFGEFIGIYRQLLDRKKFKEPNDILEFRTMQQRLPDKYKMGIFLARSNGASSSGAVCTAIGNTGVYIFGATNDQGMKTNGTYLIQWKIIQWMKKNGCMYYNLNGINPEKNPGTYHFKAGISGKTGKDVRYLGRFDSYSGSLKATLSYKANLALKSIKSKLA